MKKIAIFIIIAGWIISSTSCSKKGGPNPDDTSLIKGGARGNFNSGAGSDGFSEGGDLASGGIPLSNDLEDGLELQDDAWASDAALTGADDQLFPPILFGFDQYNVAPEERPKLQQIAEYLQINRDARILVEGHCDWKGTPAYNKSLGDRRAGSVKDYLIDLGAESSRIDVVSYGDEMATPNADGSIASQERKARFLVLK